MDELEKYYHHDKEKRNIKLTDNIDLSLLNAISMNEYTFATKEKPIIGTYALASCLGIIIGDNHGNYAIAHILNDYDKIIKSMLKGMVNDSILKVILIPGYDTRTSKIYEIIEYLKSRDNFFLYDFDIEIKNLSNYINEETESIEFAFDIRTKEFVKPNYNEYLESRGR